MQASHRKSQPPQQTRARKPGHANPPASSPSATDSDSDSKSKSGSESQSESGSDASSQSGSDSARSSASSRSRTSASSRSGSRSRSRSASGSSSSEGPSPKDKPQKKTFPSRRPSTNSKSNKKRDDRGESSPTPSSSSSSSDASPPPKKRPGKRSKMSSRRRESLVQSSGRKEQRRRSTQKRAQETHHHHRKHSADVRDAWIGHTESDILNEMDQLVVKSDKSTDTSGLLMVDAAVDTDDLENEGGHRNGSSLFGLEGRQVPSAISATKGAQEDESLDKEYVKIAYPKGPPAKMSALNATPEPGIWHGDAKETYELPRHRRKETSTNGAAQPTAPQPMRAKLLLPRSQSGTYALEEHVVGQFQYEHAFSPNLPAAGGGGGGGEGNPHMEKPGQSSAASQSPPVAWDIPSAAKPVADTHKGALTGGNVPISSVSHGGKRQFVPERKVERTSSFMQAEKPLAKPPAPHSHADRFDNQLKSATPLRYTHTAAEPSHRSPFRSAMVAGNDSPSFGADHYAAEYNSRIAANRAVPTLQPEALSLPELASTMPPLTISSAGTAVSHDMSLVEYNTSPRLLTPADLIATPDVAGPRSASVSANEAEKPLAVSSNWVAPRSPEEEADLIQKAATLLLQND